MASARLLYLDYDLIRHNPKLIIGFSDLTALINGIHTRTGLVTFHGPEAEDQLVQTTYAQGRYLHQLWLAGKLQQVVGVAFGQFEEVEERVFTLHEVLAEWFIALEIPALYGLVIGHMDEQATIPIGCEAELDVEAGTLTLLEAAVV